MLFFFFNDTATTEIYTTVHTLSLHDALPIYAKLARSQVLGAMTMGLSMALHEEDRKSTRLELQSRTVISYAVFCLKKKKKGRRRPNRASWLPRAPRSSSRTNGRSRFSPVFFFNDTATTEIYTTVHTLSLHDALPICVAAGLLAVAVLTRAVGVRR